MQDLELYQQILGVASPWKVSEVQLDHEEQEIRVRVEHPRGTRFCCPECQAELACYDHAEERRWRHLDSCQYRTIIVAAPPRVKCPEHGVKTAVVPWAEKNSRFTMTFERFAIDVLMVTQTVQGAQKLLRISWDETWHIATKAVARGQARKTERNRPRLGIDEKAFRKGHDYITLIYDIDESTVEAISDGNDAEAADACFSQLSATQIAAVEAMAMDMSAAYVKSARDNLSEADEKITHDRFHVMQLATKAVDQVRRGEHRELTAAGDHRLKRTKYLWLTSQENLTDQQHAHMDQVFHLQLKTGKAWAYKELLRELWLQEDAASATEYFNNWYRRVIHTKLAPMKKLARTIKARLAQVVNYCTHRITNGVAEGLNSKIMAIKRGVGGFRNRANFKTAIYFYCGGLDLDPR